MIIATIKGHEALTQVSRYTRYELLTIVALFWMQNQFNCDVWEDMNKQ